MDDKKYLEKEIGRVILMEGCIFLHPDANSLDHDLCAIEIMDLLTLAKRKNIATTNYISNIVEINKKTNGLLQEAIERNYPYNLN